MQEFDGISIIPEFNWMTPDRIMQVDACLEGCGAWSEGEYFHTSFPRWLQKVKGISINEKECLALIVGLKVWKQKIRNKHFLVYCDNQATVEIINTGRAKNEFARECLREICYITATANAMVKVVHQRGTENKIADFLSRWNKGPQYRENFEEMTRDC